MDGPKYVTLTEQDFPVDRHRRLIGFLGLFLPIAVYPLAGLLPTRGLDDPWARLDSISAYYYTGAGVVFVGVLCTLSLFLWIYEGYKESVWDRRLGRIAGAAALGVAVLPCTPPAGVPSPLWWRPMVANAHYASAAVLFTSFILFATWLFRKSNAGPRAARPADKRWRDDICLTCGLIMIAAMAWALVAGVANRPIFVQEAVAIGGFAIAWLVKGGVINAILPRS